LVAKPALAERGIVLKVVSGDTIDGTSSGAIPPPSRLAAAGSASYR
jgi:hypothetical protein